MACSLLPCRRAPEDVCSLTSPRVQSDQPGEAVSTIHTWVVLDWVVLHKAAASPGLRAPGFRASELRAPGMRAPGLRAPWLRAFGLRAAYCCTNTAVSVSTL